jgi:hypothetical protein
VTDALKTLLASKRFLVVTTAVLVLAAFVVAGRMSVDQFVDRFTVLAGLLASLYGLENAATAIKGPPATTLTATLEQTAPAPTGDKRDGL